MRRLGRIVWWLGPWASTYVVWRRQLNHERELLRAWEENSATLERWLKRCVREIERSLGKTRT